ncbi:MAG: adenine deaminase [Chloroflexi bacterium]|nr:adenine deaminase [Chloroflexota bacterium]
MDDIRPLVRVALGKEKADVVIKGGDLVNVYTGEILKNHSVSIKGGKIAFVGKDADHTIGPNTRTIDSSGKVIVPGFIDGHFHASISLDELLKYSLPSGTTTIFVELVDLATIVGYSGAVTLLDNARGQPGKFFGLAPSYYTVPPFLQAGEPVISGEDVGRLLQREDVAGLGETLWTSVVNEEDETIQNMVMATKMKKTLEGHASGVKGNNLVAYVASGISSCHESIRAEEALERLRLGLHVMIREGSIRRDLAAVAKILDEAIDFRRLVLVTDGLNAEDLFHNGHMAHVVQKAMDLGFPPVEAIRMATLNVAEHFGMDNVIGGIAPGRYADILVLPSLDRIDCEYVISNGRVVVDNKKSLVQPKECVYPESVTMSVRVPRNLVPEDFRIPANGRTGEVVVRALKLVSEVITEQHHARLPVRGNSIMGDLQKDVLKVSIIERRNNTGKVVSGFIQGIGLKSGACACSYSWEIGSPMVVTGVNESDMAFAVNRLVELQGGLVVCKDQQITAEVSLPIGGYITKGPLSEAAEGLERVRQAMKDQGSPLTNPFLSLQTIPGTFLPFFRITNQGLVDMKRRRLLDIIVE